MDIIWSDADVFPQIQEKSRKVYEKAWKESMKFNKEFNFDVGPSGEEILINYFKYI